MWIQVQLFLLGWTSSLCLRTWVLIQRGHTARKEILMCSTGNSTLHNLLILSYNVRQKDPNSNKGGRGNEMPSQEILATMTYMCDHQRCRWENHIYYLLSWGFPVSLIRGEGGKGRKLFKYKYMMGCLTWFTWEIRTVRIVRNSSIFQSINFGASLRFHISRLSCS